MSHTLTLVFNVDRIKLTMDILSSFTPELRISGRNSDAKNYHRIKTQSTDSDNEKCLFS